MITASQASARVSAGLLGLAALLVFLGTPAAAAEKLQFVTWTDPTEQAFTVQVPRGWQVSGGINRRYLMLLSERIEVQSPDGTTWVYIGNDFPAFVPPNQILEWAGIYEGMPIPRTPGSMETNPQYVLRYRTGKEFAVDVLLPDRQSSGYFDSFQVTGQRERPEVAEAVAGEANGSLDAGEVTYTFRRGATSGSGRVICITEDAGPALWRVWRIFHVETAAGREAEGQRVLMRMIATTRINLDWALRLEKLRAVQAGIVARSQREVAEIISRSYWDRQSVLDRVFHTGGLARRGTVDLFDPVNNQVLYNERGGADYYWLDDAGRILRTNDPNPPGPGYRPLQVLP